MLSLSEVLPEGCLALPTVVIIGSWADLRSDMFCVDRICHNVTQRLSEATAARDPGV